MEKIKEPLKLGAILGAIALVIAVMLSFVNSITAERIEAVNAQIIQDGLKEVMPSSGETEFIPMGGVDLTNSQNIEISSLYIAIDANENVIGYCATVMPNGYGGSIETIVGMNLSGTITGVKVTSNMSETAGLGAKAKSREEFTYQFEQKTAPFKLAKDGGAIDAITSATITSRAITDGVNAAAEVMQKNNIYGEFSKEDIIDGKYTVKAENPPEENSEEANSEEGEVAENE